MEEVICKRCSLLCTIKEIDQYDNLVEKLLSIPESSPFNGPCRFCLGLFNISQLKPKIIEVKDKLKEYDHKSYKIITNFSCLFALFHNYLKLKISIIEQLSTVHSENIQTTTLRKCFKPLLTPLIKDILDKPPSNEGEATVFISFNFSNKLYDYIGDFITSLGNNDVIYTISESDDISKIKHIFNTVLNPVLLNAFDKQFNWNELLLDITFQIKSDEFYIKGNYLKFSRDVPQTKWEKNGIKLCSTSVDEEIKRSLLKYFLFEREDECTISAGGREDRDVRMLGNGRPFIYKITNAKKRFDIDYSLLTSLINDNSNTIRVVNMSHCARGEFNTLAKCSEAKQKRYMCLIWCQNEINDESFTSLQNITHMKITQKTPLRVIHKRVMKIREKEILKLIPGKIINDHFFTLEILASAGTYIKEFVHSDIGRTYPSISSLLKCECDILQLDVLDIIY